MAALIDTNVLLRSLNPSDPHYAAATKALAESRTTKETLCIAPQNLVEFWVVATRPANQNGLGMTVLQAEKELASIREFFRVLPYTQEVLEAWQKMVIRHSVSGKQAHDAHLAAFMQVHGITDILTFNSADFGRFPGIRALIPADV